MSRHERLSSSLVGGIWQDENVNECNQSLENHITVKSPRHRIKIIHLNETKDPFLSNENSINLNRLVVRTLGGGSYTSQLDTNRTQPHELGRVNDEQIGFDEETLSLDSSSSLYGVDYASIDQSVLTLKMEYSEDDRTATEISTKREKAFNPIQKSYLLHRGDDDESNLSESDSILRLDVQKDYYHENDENDNDDDDGLGDAYFLRHMIDPPQSILACISLSENSDILNSSDSVGHIYEDREDEDDEDEESVHGNSLNLKATNRRHTYASDLNGNFTDSSRSASLFSESYGNGINYCNNIESQQLTLEPVLEVEPQIIKQIFKQSKENQFSGVSWSNLSSLWSFWHFLYQIVCESSQNLHYANLFSYLLSTWGSDSHIVDNTRIEKETLLDSKEQKLIAIVMSSNAEKTQNYDESGNQRQQKETDVTNALYQVPALLQSVFGSKYRSDTENSTWLSPINKAQHNLRTQADCELEGLNRQTTASEVILKLGVGAKGCQAIEEWQDRTSDFSNDSSSNTCNIQGITVLNCQAYVLNAVSKYRRQVLCLPDDL
jgi:hypothetical protein